MAREYEDLSGNFFGRWFVLNEAEPKYYNGKMRRYWNCRCSCGTVRAVGEPSLKSGKSTSCGCYHSEIMHDVGKRHSTHGQADTRLYRIYRHMLCRCSNPNDIRFKYYGDRGISVCDEWSTFEPFYKWALQNGYSEDKSIDRIDLDKGYSPDNCRWATNEEQANNKSNIVYLEYDNRRMSIAQWAKELNMPYKKLHKRIYSGWDVERALTT